MKAELFAAIGYLAMVGVGAGWYTFLHITSAEGMVLATVLLSVCMYLGAYVGSASIAVPLFIALGIAGWAAFALKGKMRREFFSPALIALSILFAGSLAAFHGAFVQNIDDFHQWAAAVRYMLQHNHLPQADFLGSASMPAYTGTFHLYFQVLGGYNEGVMYASSMLLNASPLMIAISGKKWKDGKSVLWYVLFTYLGMFHLYNHAYKSLYVDVTAAAWAAGLAVWWIGRLDRSEMSGDESKRSVICNVLYFIPALWFTVATKWGIGLLLAGFALTFMITSTLVYMGKEEIFAFYTKHKRKILAGLILCLLILAGGILIWQRNLIPVSLGGVKEALTLRSDKARKTFLAIVDKVFSKKLNAKSRLQITAAPIVFAMSIGIMMAASFEKGKRKQLAIAQSLFTLVSFGLYLLALYITYVSTFSYDESTSAAAAHRYFSCMVLFLFFLMMGNFIRIQRDLADVTVTLTRGVLLLTAAVGLRSSFICEASAFHYWEVSGYKSIKEAKSRLKSLEEAVEETDKVYLIHQEPSLSDMDEFSLCTLLYYREGGISNYLREPWKYTEEGSLRMVRTTSEVLTDLPEHLKEGDYRYLWIYSTDEYLSENLPQVFTMDEEVQEGGLYEVTYENDQAVLSLTDIVD